jgi:hypothetical protein
MIDRKTGEILLPLDGIRVGPSLTREWFLASRVAKECKELVRNEPYCSFDLPRVSFQGRCYAWSLWFKGSALTRVSICCADAEFGLSWDDWSEEKERARERTHEEVLNSALGADWREAKYGWGSVFSGYDPKGGGSSVEVTYIAN